MAVSDDAGDIYYLDLAGDVYEGGREKIYRLKAGEKTPAVMNEDKAWILNISGKYLYHSNLSDNHRLYRLSLDNAEKLRLGAP